MDIGYSDLHLLPSLDIANLDLHDVPGKGTVEPPVAHRLIELIVLIELLLSILLRFHNSLGDPASEGNLEAYDCGLRVEWEDVLHVEGLVRVVEIDLLQLQVGQTVGQLNIIAETSERQLNLIILLGVVTLR